MSEVYYEVQMTRVLHTVRISNVLMGTEIFCSSWELRIFSLSHARDKMKKHLPLKLNAVLEAHLYACGEEVDQ